MGNLLPSLALAREDEATQKGKLSINFLLDPPLLSTANGHAACLPTDLVLPPATSRSLLEELPTIETSLAATPVASTASPVYLPGVESLHPNSRPARIEHHQRLDIDPAHSPRAHGCSGRSGSAPSANDSGSIEGHDLSAREDTRRRASPKQMHMLHQILSCYDKSPQKIKELERRFVAPIRRRKRRDNQAIFCDWCFGWGLGSNTKP